MPYKKEYPRWKVLTDDVIIRIGVDMVSPKVANYDLNVGDFLQQTGEMEETVFYQNKVRVQRIPIRTEQGFKSVEGWVTPDSTPFGGSVQLERQLLEGESAKFKYIASEGEDVQDGQSASTEGRGERPQAERSCVR